MTKVSVDDMLSGKASKYALAVAVAKRAREITDEIILNADVVEDKSVNMAIEEFKNHKYYIVEPDGTV